MAKFNVIQKERRAKIADRKRVIHGNPNTGKLKNKPQPLSISGKRKRKLFKKWRRDQKEAVQKGIVTMQDVEMVLSEDIDNNSPKKFHLKKSSKLQIKKLKGKGKNRRKSSKPATGASVDAMVE
eukprot:TRINITY_DN12380_c0_g1_i2.p1 TRINITY_DN12380_c0_g1~~TRINITY_DN12380_c0_g1_i2.p1  ORF type:complete len:134 (-),score=38.66 TRINITY_DN12380_c0_g1_i2:341-712(-)